MSQLSAELRREREWWIKYADANEQSACKAAVAKRPWTVKRGSSSTDIILNTKQIQYVFDELAGYAELRDDTYRCQISCFERIWESDCPLSDCNLSSALQHHLSTLKNQQQFIRRFAGQDNAFEIYYVDPLIYPLVYGSTFVANSDASRPPETVSAPATNDGYTISSKFALLPSDVDISADGSARFLSYINNLHWEDNLTLYTTLERLLTKTIPLFEHTLTDLHRNNPISPRIQGPSRYTVWDEPDPPDHSDDEDGWSTYERNMRDWAMNRPIQLPEVPESGYPGGLETRRHTVNLRGRKVQIITRILELELTDERPEHQGFDWRVEGMRNERVVACAMHVLACDNVEPCAALEFRMAVSHPRGFAPGDEGATLRTWGFKHGDPCHQYVGHTPLLQNLSITFPNLYQHRMAHLKRADASRDGRVALVSFLLVDPDIRPIISTATVAPQQPSWIKKALYDNLCPRIPSELVEIIWTKCDWVLTEDEAEDYRGDYYDILQGFTRRNNQFYFSLPFDGWAGGPS